MLSAPDGDSLPSGAVPLPGRVQRAGSKVSPGWREDSGSGDPLGFVRIQRERRHHRGTAALVCSPSVGKSPLEETA